MTLLRNGMLRIRNGKKFDFDNTSFLYIKSCSKLIITKMNEFSEDKPLVIIQGISQAANCGTRVSFFILFPPQAETDVKNSTNALSSNIRW